MLGMFVTTVIALGIALGAVWAAVSLVRYMDRAKISGLKRFAISICVFLLIGVVLAASLAAFLGGTCLAVGWMNGGHFVS